MRRTVLAVCLLAASCSKDSGNQNSPTTATLQETGFTFHQGDPSCTGCPWPVVQMQPNNGAFELQRTFRYSAEYKFKGPTVCTRQITTTIEWDPPARIKSGFTNCNSDPPGTLTNDATLHRCTSTFGECQMINSAGGSIGVRFDIPSGDRWQDKDRISHNDLLGLEMNVRMVVTESGPDVQPTTISKEFRMKVAQ